jgi:RNA polymerase sigma-70 factor (ECF subfamily)
VEIAVPEAAARRDERSLLSRARGGDADAFLALVEPYDRGLRALAFRLLGEADLMDEALQTAYANAFRGIRSFRGRAAVSTWLYRVAYNACLDELRRQARRPEPSLLSDVAASAETDPAERIAGRLDLGAALRALPVDLRAPVLLVDGEGLTYPEAARVLGIPEGTVASRLGRARAALRAALTDRREDR